MSIIGVFFDFVFLAKIRNRLSFEYKSEQLTFHICKNMVCKNNAEFLKK